MAQLKDLTELTTQGLWQEAKGDDEDWWGKRTIVGRTDKPPPQPTASDYRREHEGALNR